MSKYKIMMTGGGSAGHVMPNLALIPELTKRGFEIKYIGSNNGIEKEIIKNTSIPYYGISSGKLRRYFDIKNFSDPFKVIKGVFDAWSILTKEKPDVIFSKGGFVTVPVVMAASLKRIPVVSHESDMTPGLANKLASPFCDKLCVTFPESLKYIKSNKGVLTGTPIRQEIFQGSRLKGKNICTFPDNKPVLLIIGGSLGSKIINDAVRQSIDELLKRFNIVHICGKGNIDEKLRGALGYIQFEYVSEDLPHVMAYADFIISRAGANTIFELLALRKPNVLIPLSKRASRGDQVLNANSFKKAGYSVVLEEECLNEESLIKSLDDLRRTKDACIRNMGSSEMKNGVGKIIDVIMSVVNK